MDNLILPEQRQERASHVTCFVTDRCHSSHRHRSAPPIRCHKRVNYVPTSFTLGIDINVYYSPSRDINFIFDGNILFPVAYPQKHREPFTNQHGQSGSQCPIANHQTHGDYSSVQVDKDLGVQINPTTLNVRETNNGSITPDRVRMLFR